MVVLNFDLSTQEAKASASKEEELRNSGNVVIFSGRQLATSRWAGYL